MNEQIIVKEIKRSRFIINPPEHIMLDEEGVVARLENKVLHEGLWDVLVRLVKLDKC